MSNENKPCCSFCKQPIADLYKIVDGYKECIKCFVWLNLLKQKIEKSA